MWYRLVIGLCLWIYSLGLWAQSDTVGVSENQLLEQLVVATEQHDTYQKAQLTARLSEWYMQQQQWDKARLYHRRSLASIDTLLQQQKQQHALNSHDLVQQSQNVTIASLVGLLGALVLAGVFFQLFNQKRLLSRQMITANRQISQTVAELEAANEQINNSMGEKETLLKEIHHRVKNNLQLVSSLIEWQFEDIDDPIVKKKVDEGRSRIRSMALMHEYLYKSDNLAHVAIHRYLGELADTLTRTYRPHTGITLEKELAHLYLEPDRAVPLGLIANELISNAFKYAFPNAETGEVSVHLERIDDEEYWLVVRDNGIGLPPDFNNIEHKSLGIQLVKTLTKQLKAQLRTYNAEGAVFELRFRIR
ncbi:MAG: sensor histidine kinase [Chitinophagales bacterium]|jgi:two-component sensor histidine kinase|nr:sensor histidine kinase [Chitinophagales bacterium]